MLIPFYNQKSDIPEQYQDLYKENQEGLHVLQVQAKEGYALENVAPLKNALTRQKDKVTQLQTVVDSIPEGFSFDQYEKEKQKFDAAGSFDREKEMKELKIQVQKDVEAEFSSLIKDKDSIIEKQQSGMKNAARETLYGKLEAKGWPKLVVKGLVESMTKVDIGDDGGVLQYVKDDGSIMRKTEDNGDQREYTDNDLIDYLTSHEHYGKLIPSKDNSGDGGESSYSKTDYNNGAKVIGSNEVGNNLEDIANGTVIRAN